MGTTLPWFRHLHVLFMIAASAAFLAGCSTTQKADPRRDAFSELKAYEANGKYYSAFKMLPAALDQMKREDPTAFVTEGGSGNFEYDHLLMITAVSGEKDWLKILQDPDIPLSWKHDLVDWISDAAMEGTYAPKGPAKPLAK